MSVLVSGKDREMLLRFIDDLKDTVGNAIAVYATWEIEKPSLDFKYAGMPYARWEGQQNHTRYTCTIDVISSQSLISKVNKDE